MSGAKKLKYRKVVASTQLWQGAGQHGQGQWACPDPVPYPREKGPHSNPLPWWAPLPEPFSDVSAQQSTSQALQQVECGQDACIHVETPPCWGARVMSF